jgi:hypothetical protein
MRRPFLRSLGIGTAILSLASASACRARQAAPDQIYLNARIWTGDSARMAATAIAVRGDRIVAVGDDAAVRALAGETTTIEDLGGGA